jgi:hypothetical protein
MSKRITNTKGIQAPAVALTHEAENATKVVGKYYAREPRTVDEARCLEDFLILGSEFRFMLGVIPRYFIWVCPGIALIDFKKFVGNILNMRINDKSSRQKIEDVRCGCG